MTLAPPTAERERHLAELEEYRSGKNKNDAAKYGAGMIGVHVKTLENNFSGPSLGCHY